MDEARIAPDAGGRPPRLAAIFGEFLLIGATSFGGGLAAYFKILLTEKRRWLDEDSFNAMLAMSQTLPGLNAVNLAVLAGDRLRGAAGAIAAALGLLLPGSLFVLAAGTFYLRNAADPWLAAFLAAAAAAATGLLCAVIARLGGRRFLEPRYLFIVLASFGLMSFADMSLPLVLLIVVPVSLWLHRPGRQKEKPRD